MNPARRAIVRWAWRMFRRDWRQQVLVLAMVTVTVAASVTGTAMVVNGFSTTHGFGSGDAFVHIERGGDTGADADAVLDAVRSRFGVVDVVGHQPVQVPGFAERLDLRSQDPDGPYSGPLLDLRHGRYPAAPGEIAFTPFVAETLGVGIGDQLDLDRRSWTVVGEVENPSALGDDFALVAPEAAATAPTLTVLLDSSTHGTGAPADAGRQPSFGVQQVGDDDAAVATLVLVVVSLAMTLTALVATAGFVVVAQRRQRQLGLLAASGATERHLRLVMVANGSIVGLVAATAGGILGIAGWVAAAPAVEAAAEHRIDRFDLPWSLIAACLVLGVLASTVAAWSPARTIARMPVVVALSRRPGRPLPVGRSLASAGALVALGIGAIIRSNPMGEVTPLFLVAGLLAVVVGVVLVAPAAVRALGPLAARLPLAPRLALRDLTRYQARAASALGAIALALGVSVSVIVVATASTAPPGEGNLSDRQVLIRADGPIEVGTGDELAARVAAAIGDDDVVALERAVVADSQESPPPLVEVATPIDDGFRHVDEAYVATPEVLAALGIDPESIDPSTELVTSIDRDDIVLLDPSFRPDGELPPPQMQIVDLAEFSAAPHSFITEAAMAAHGWEPVQDGWFAEADHPLSPDELRAARDLAGELGLSVEARWDQDSLAAVQTAASVVGVVLALAIVATSISLLRGESAQDLRTLAATGAPPRTRRALMAATAGALASLGVLLSTAGASAAVVAAYHSQLDRLVPLPAPQLLAIVVGLPVAAAATGWLLAGREPAALARQVFE